MSYLERMQRAIRAYEVEARRAANDIAMINKNYKPEAAKKVADEVKDRLRDHYDKAVREIRQAQAEGEREAEAWGRMDGAQITKDAELLKYDIAPDDFENLVERYRNNATMSKILYQYGEKRNKEMQEKKGPLAPGGYNLANIETPQAHIHRVTATGNTAVDVLDRLTIEPGYMHGLDSPMARAGYDSFMALEN